MTITADNLTFRHMETKDPAIVTVFLSLDGTLADGSPVAGPWRSVVVELNDSEQAVAATIKDRAKAALVAQINGA